MLDEIERSGEPDATTLPPALNNNRVRAAASQLATFWSPPTAPKWEIIHKGGTQGNGGRDARLSLPPFPSLLFRPMLISLPPPSSYGCASGSEQETHPHAIIRVPSCITIIWGCLLWMIREAARTPQPAASRPQRSTSPRPAARSAAFWVRQRELFVPYSRPSVLI